MQVRQADHGISCPKGDTEPVALGTGKQLRDIQERRRRKWVLAVRHLPYSWLLTINKAQKFLLSNLPISAGRHVIWFFGKSRILMA